MALTDTTLKALKPRDKTYTISNDRCLYRRGAALWSSPLPTMR